MVYKTGGDTLGGERKIGLLSATRLGHKLKLYKKLNKLPFVPKLVDVVLEIKDGSIIGFKVISQYIKGITLEKYIKKIRYR